MYKKLFFIFLLPILVFCSCKKEEEEPFILRITPEHLVLQGKADEVKQFHLKASSGSPINRLIITSKEGNSFTKTELDSILIPVRNFNYTYEFRLPSSPDDYQLTMVFRVYDEAGNEAVASRTLQVKGVAEKPLKEYTGNELFSAQSGKPDAYDIHNRLALHASISDSSIKDLQDETIVAGEEQLSKSWISPSGGKFVLFEGFDYVNATRSSVINAFNAGSKLDKVSNIRDNLVILIKTSRGNEELYSVIKIVQVIDSEGTENDRYIFSMKQ
ncbi:MAG: hypothetical protein ACK4ND_10555 [Cytophagaceae bacterium]